MVMMSNTIVSGSAATIALWIASGILWLGEKTTTNENRYNDRGITHKSGMGVMSVVMKEVTPSIMLEGTNANPIHRSRLISVGALESPPAIVSPKEPPTSGEPPPAPTGGLGAPPSTPSSRSSSWTVAEGERQSM